MDGSNMSKKNLETLLDLTGEYISEFDNTDYVETMTVNEMMETIELDISRKDEN